MSLITTRKHQHLQSPIGCSLKGLIKRITQFNGASNAYKWGSTMIQGKRRVDDITSCAAVCPKPTCCLQGLQMCDDCSFGQPCNSQNTMTIQKNLVPTGKTYSNNNILNSHSKKMVLYKSVVSVLVSVQGSAILTSCLEPFFLRVHKCFEEQMKFYIRSH